MLIGKVIGRVVATRKEEKLLGARLLIVQPLGLDQKPLGAPLVCIDSVDAGFKETVLIVQGSSARLVTNQSNNPVDAAIVGIIDSIKIDK
ncbi:EutN/CcmL family microcompartment protein [bacterium]|nr:EutN/CcmL family microcompartment protein [bacterium]